MSMTTPNAAASLERLEQDWRDKIAANRAKESRSAVEAAKCAAMEWCADELATLRESLAQQGESLTDTFVQQVPDKCDRITWRGHYYHLPITHPAAVDEVTNAMVERACKANIHPLAEPSETERKHMRAALTAALQPATSDEAG